VSQGIGRSVGIYPSPDGKKYLFVDPKLPEDEKLELLKVAAVVLRR
jgi:hypothetical protein